MDVNQVLNTQGHQGQKTVNLPFKIIENDSHSNHIKLKEQSRKKFSHAIPIFPSFNEELNRRTGRAERYDKYERPNSSERNLENKLTLCYCYIVT